MKKYQKFNAILNFIICTLVGAFIAEGIYKYWDYKTHPDLYAVSSAPLVYGYSNLWSSSCKRCSSCYDLENNHTEKGKIVKSTKFQ